MFKISLLIISISLMSFSSSARTLYTHAEFVHQSDTQKNAFIIKTMEMVVELESKYEKELVSQNPDQEKLRRYSKILNELKSLLISSAHAAEVKPLALPTTRSAKDFAGIANDFNNLLKKPEMCIYGGWISRMSLKGVKLADGSTTKRSLCIHPNHINDGIPATSYPAETLAYASAKNCMGKNKITCNPVVFGYKKQSDNTLFCVDAGVSSSGVNQADNSSLYCMRAALEEKSSPDQDSVESRLSYLRKALSEKPEIYQSVQQLIFKSCICVDPKNNINKDYLKYMQPHQTCYGMMEMMAETTICEDPKFAMDTTVFEKIRDYAKDKFDRSTSSPSQIRDYYKNFVINIQSNTPEEYTKFCGGVPVKKAEVTPPVEKPEVKVEEPVKKKEYLCKNATCSSSETKEGEAEASQSCQYEVTDSEGAAVEFKEASKEVSSSEPVTLKVSGTVGSENVNLECIVESKPKEEAVIDETPPTLEVAKKEDGKLSYKVTATISEPNQGWAFRWFFKNNGDYKPVEGWKTDSKTTPKSEITLAGEEETPEEVPETTVPTEATRDQLEITQARSTVNYDVCGEISKGDKKFEKCTTIDMLVKAPAKASGHGGNTGNAAPQTPIRGSSDTSAVGIK